MNSEFLKSFIFVAKIKWGFSLIALGFLYPACFFGFFFPAWLPTCLALEIFEVQLLPSVCVSLSHSPPSQHTASHLPYKNTVWFREQRGGKSACENLQMQALSGNKTKRRVSYGFKRVLQSTLFPPRSCCLIKNIQDQQKRIHFLSLVMFRETLYLQTGTKLIELTKRTTSVKWIRRLLPGHLKGYIIK